MTATPLTLDPEIQGLIQEIAATPNSTLLRKPRSDVFHSPYDRVRSTTPGLTTAERHLVRVHAEELAYWLRVACVMGLLSEAKTSRYHSQYRGLEERIEVPSEAEWRSKYSRNRVEDLVATGQASYLRRLAVDGIGPRHKDVGELAGLSARLAPSDEARIYSALYLLDIGEHQSSASLFRTILAGHLSPESQRVCRSGIGSISFSVHNYVAAREQYREAASHGAPAAPPLIGWLVCSALIGDAADTQRAADQLDDWMPEDCPALEDYLARNSGELRAMKGPVQASPALRSLLVNRLEGTASRRVASELL